MIVNNIKRLADSSGIGPHGIWKAIGGSKSTAYRLYSDREAIPGKAVLERLLEAYGWQPGEIIRGVPDNFEKGFDNPEKVQ